jgi:Acetyltransferases, including N-acetylases of ribosomal proteins
MKIKKNEITLYEFSDEDNIFDEYCSFLRNYENIKMIGRYDYLLSMDKSKISEYLKYMNNSVNDSFFAVDFKSKFIGTLKIGHIDWKIGTGDLGILIGDLDYRGKGLSEKICRVGLEYAFNVLGLRRMSAGCYEKNIAMCRCFERIGFKKIGVERENVSLGGMLCNHVLYDILKSEYKE